MFNTSGYYWRLLYEVKSCFKDFFYLNLNLFNEKSLIAQSMSASLCLDFLKILYNVQGAICNQRLVYVFGIFVT